MMSNKGVPIQDISNTIGRKSTHVAETVYRHVIVPEITPVPDADFSLSCHPRSPRRGSATPRFP
jgi:hypothetical protein